MKTVALKHVTLHTKTGESEVSIKVPNNARIELVGFQPGMESRFDIVIIDGESTSPARTEKRS